MVESTIPTRIGIVGGGQLATMSTIAAERLGFSVTVLDQAGSECSAARLTNAAIIKGGLRDAQSLEELARRSEILTVEIEHLDPIALQAAARKYGRTVNPDPTTIMQIQDKYRQHQILEAIGVPVAPFKEVQDASDVARYLGRSPEGLVLKARKDAYDGRGNRRIHSEDDIEAAIKELRENDPNRELYVERRIPFKYGPSEYAMMVAIDVNGNTKRYPLAETRNLRDQLREVRVPANVPEDVLEQANVIVDLVAGKFLRGAGMFGIEMFLDRNNLLMVNEIAPRVHNSGHYTDFGCQTSQFENHIRAISGMTLGETDLLYNYAGMVNIIGRIGELEELEEMDGVEVTLYAKDERPDRKIGHVTIVGDDKTDFENRFSRVSSLLTPAA